MGLTRKITPQKVPQYDILNEILYGQHLNKDRETIDVAQISKHGNMDLFFASVCAILYNATSYPSFNKSKAVQTIVKHFVETEIAYHRARFISKFGETFLQHDSFPRDLWYILVHHHHLTKRRNWAKSFISTKS